MFIQGTQKINEVMQFTIIPCHVHRRSEPEMRTRFFNQGWKLSHETTN